MPPPDEAFHFPRTSIRKLDPLTYLFLLNGRHQGSRDSVDPISLRDSAGSPHLCRQFYCSPYHPGTQADLIALPSFFCSAATGSSFCQIAVFLRIQTF
jgi:hypothetical protein